MDLISDKSQKIIPYEELRVTTITLVMTLSGTVYTENAFNLLPITRVEIQQTRESSKCKLPHCSVPGSILSMRYKQNTRGIIKNKTQPFKNAVTIDISTTKKNISMKLSGSSIQMCGASSKDDGIEAATHVLNHLKKIQYMLDIIQNDTNKGSKEIEWVKMNTLGNVIIKDFYEIRHCNNVTLRIYRTINDNEIIKPINPIPDNLNIELTLFLLSLCDDFRYHSDMCLKLNHIPNVLNVIEQPLNLKHVGESMVNYNYSLGFQVDRNILNQLMDGRNGFISRHDNALNSSVTIELPYELPHIAVTKRRKGKIPHHTFLVYKSGSVTQSGPGGEIMRDAYYLFINTIANIAHLIRYHQPILGLN